MTTPFSLSGTIHVKRTSDGRVLGNISCRGKEISAYGLGANGSMQSLGIARTLGDALTMIESAAQGLADPTADGRFIHVFGTLHFVVAELPGLSLIVHADRAAGGPDENWENVTAIYEDSKGERLSAGYIHRHDDGWGVRVGGHRGRMKKYTRFADAAMALADIAHQQAKGLSAHQRLAYGPSLAKLRAQMIRATKAADGPLWKRAAAIEADMRKVRAARRRARQR